jgi:hypothetical protein
LLWVGTDDGNVKMTKDSGEEWTLVGDNITGNPHYWVTRVTASPHDAGTAFVTSAVSVETTSGHTSGRPPITVRPGPRSPATCPMSRST